MYACTPSTPFPCTRQEPSVPTPSGASSTPGRNSTRLGSPTPWRISITKVSAISLRGTHLLCFVDASGQVHSVLVQLAYAGRHQSCRYEIAHDFAPGGHSRHV